jgi:Tfp pilus assembly protein PilZ
MADPVESPYLPDGRQWAWSASHLSLAKDCWRKYFYAARLGLARKDLSVDLVFGKHYAKALERYHKLRTSGPAPHEIAVRAVVKEALEETANWHPAHNFKTRENLIRSIVWYLETYRNDPCKTLTLADGRPAVELPFRFQITDEYVLCGHLDRIVEYSGGLYVQDQKTTGATLGAYYFKRFNPDVQMSLYSVAAKVVWATPVQGVMIDAAQIAVGFTRFERGFTYRTEEQLTEWIADTLFVVNQQESAEAAGWPMNDAACQKYGGCQFLEVCSKSPQVRKEFLETGFEKNDYNPLELR